MARRRRRSGAYEKSPEIIQPIDSVLIANRGEIAQRIAEVAHRLGKTAFVGYAGSDYDSLPVRTVMAYGEEDGKSNAAPLPGRSPAILGDIPMIVATAQIQGADAVHPGYGFLAENSEAAAALAEKGIRFIGPSPEVIATAGDKARSRELAKECDVPLLPGTKVLRDQKDALRQGRKLGFPAMLKATDAGGGAGNRSVHNEKELESAYVDLRSSFPDLYLEKQVVDARHIEIQIAGDKYGNVLALGERDCSPQRLFQKVVEESPAPGLPARTRQKMMRDAERMAGKIDYHGLGTWEFLYEPSTGNHYFMEINPRIQVEHPVTEGRYGIDLIELQFAIEEGRALPESLPLINNHVIEARLYAEKADFSPDSGTLEVLNLPEIEGVRVDAGYEQGDVLPMGFDTTIAKLIATGQNREEARAKLNEALVQTQVTGMATNREFLMWLLDSDEFVAGNVSTSSIEQAWARHQRERFRDLEGFIGEGIFTEMAPPLWFDVHKFGQDIRYSRKGMDRRYSQDLAKSHEENAGGGAFRGGVYEDSITGMRFALGIWDITRMTGTLGVEEGNAYVAWLKMAHEQGLVTVDINSSGGARQQEDTLALIQLDYMMAAKEKFSNSLTIHIDNGVNFGGLKASTASSPDIIMAVEGSKMGLTGPDVVAKFAGKAGRADLPEGAHGTDDHYTDRNIDLRVHNLEEARHRVLDLCSTLGLSGSKIPYSYNSRDFDTTQSKLYNRPSNERFHGIIGVIGRTILHRDRIGKLAEGRLVPSGQLTPLERFELLASPNRPTAADLLNPGLGVFERVSPLSNQVVAEETEQYPAIIGAIARLDGQPVMVLGQQAQRRIEDGVLRREYSPLSPKDLRWTQRKLDLAEKLNIPTIWITDTPGADAQLESEREGITTELSNLFGRLHNLDVPAISVNINQNGSGGGLIFGRPMDAAADFSNALTLVSTVPVQNWILTGEWLAGDDSGIGLLNQLKDSTAEGRLKSQQIDAIIQEPIGGAQADWLAVAGGLREFLQGALTSLKDLPLKELKRERYSRIERAATYATKKPDTFEPMAD